MTTLLICTAHALGLAIGFYCGWRYSRKRFVFLSVTSTSTTGVVRTDAERAAGMVS